MNIRIPLWLANTIVIVLLLGAGAVAGASTYRYGPYARLEARIIDARSVIEAKTKKINSLAAELSLSRKKVASLDAEIRQTRGRLGETQSRLRRSESESQQQQEIILQKEQDIYVLRTCLSGVVNSIIAASEDDIDTAIGYLRSVARECRAADRLIR